MLETSFKPKLTVHKAFRSKYFRNGNILTVELGNNPSWGWCSIMEGRKVIEKGLRWKLDNENYIRVYHDLRSPIDYPFKMPSHIPNDPSIYLVKNLIAEDGNRNEELIRLKFLVEIADHILFMQLSSSTDELEWCLSNKGKHTVDSGYKVAFSFYYPPLKLCQII